MKKLDIYILKRFLLLFAMTFLICIFILLMQFLWLHIRDLVGKGLGVVVMAEFFVYAVMTMVPLALPLAILLASLMTFGNLGESFELTAMKAAGVSLFRIMRPLIFLVALISVGSLTFSNYALPVAQKKMWALLFSLRHKSPELDIPVGEFYSGIDGLNVYVREKDGRWLKNMMIYDFSNGFNNATVMTADSGFVQITGDKKYLKLTLYTGETFENIKEQGKNTTSSIPYRREEFKQKELLIEFDSDLDRIDDDALKDQHISKNINQLLQSIDSMKKEVNVKVRQQSMDMISKNYLGRESIHNYPSGIMSSSSSSVPQEVMLPVELAIKGDTQVVQSIEPPVEVEKEESVEEKVLDKENYDMAALLTTLSQPEMEKVSSQALAKAKEKKDQVTYNTIMVNSSIVYVRRHQIELLRKFTLAFACVIFFFIGAPFGAIVRKGGFGLPAVISVLMFIIYYIIDNTGYKMAREGIWEVWQGIWLSSAILLPVGIFLTYKAATDATLFNADSYKKIFQTIKEKILIVFHRKKHTKNLNLQEYQ